jgi:hypothetical protein
MNISETLAMSSALSPKLGEASINLAEAGETISTAPSTEPGDSAARGYRTRTAPNLRSIVERRFRRMSEAHDRIRSELLAAHSSPMT